MKPNQLKPRTVGNNNPTKYFQKNLTQINSAIHAAVHDIRSPLTTIKPYIDFLKRIEDTRQQEKVLGRMKEGVDRIEDLLKGLVRYADLIDDTPMTSKVTDIRKIANKTLEKMAGQYPGVTYTHDGFRPQKPTRSELPIYIQYPLPYLQELLEHTIDNAFRFRHPDRSLHIQFNPTRKKDQLRLSISDTGLGSQDREAHDIPIAPFARGIHPQKGLGLGLALCKVIVEKNGGAIRCHCHPEGTRVEMALREYPVNLQSASSAIHLKLGDQQLGPVKDPLTGLDAEE